MRFLPVLVLLSTLAHAAPGRRFALVVGANGGARGAQPLRYAAADGARVARVLRELGGFAADDVVELHTPNAPALGDAMARMAARINNAEVNGRPPLVLFYYSG